MSNLPGPPGQNERIDITEYLKELDNLSYV